MNDILRILSFVALCFQLNVSLTLQKSLQMKYGDFSSKSPSGLWVPSWDARKGLYMADPDVAPEVNPTRR